VSALRAYRSNPQTQTTQLSLLGSNGSPPPFPSVAFISAVPLLLSLD
jgi:hypothetical protein